MRLDYFVVFPHAVDRIDEILATLRKYPDLEMIYFRKYYAPDFIEFVQNLYKADTVPWEHIRGKTEYLMGLGHDTYIGLIKNHKPEVQMVGEGEYRHPQCMLINRFKWEVREKLNPVINGERSEHHVIHASDYEEQVHNFWPTTGLHPIEQILSRPNSVLNVPFHLPVFNKFEIGEADISKLKCIEMTDGENKVVPIKKSIYYKYVMGNKKPYTDYWEKYRGVRLWEDKSPGAFDDMIERAGKNFNGYIIVKDGIILDGNHRAVIELKRGRNLCPTATIQE